jgi:hypothetical protein
MWFPDFIAVILSPLRRSSGYTNTSGLINLARACSGGGCTVTGISSVGWEDAALWKLTDGNTASNNHVFTAGGNNDWVMIDLGQTAFVNHVQIFNRDDSCGVGCAQRLNNFQIRVGDSSTFANNPACVTGESWFSKNKNFSCVLTGRYVSFQQFNNQLMNLHEMEVYGRKTSNLARACSAGNCPVTSRSLWYNELACCAPGHLVDGDLTNQFHSQCCAGSNEWVIIDLQESMYVTMVRIYNRVSCCQDRINNFEIRVGNLGSSSTFSSNPACATNQPWFDDKKDFTCVLSGRYVSVQQISNQMMNIREIEVYGLKASEVCTACLPGTFKSTTGSAACANCGVGKYQDAVVVTTNPPEASRTYESVWGNSAPGTGFALSMLDSAAAWSWSGALPEWMQIDLGSSFRVHGVVTQCRANFEQCPHEIKVQHSLTASSFASVTAVGGTTRFFLPTTWSSTLKTLSNFSQPVTARYIRIVVHACSSFRAGVLTSLASVAWNACADCGEGKYSSTTGATTVSTCQSCPTNSQSTTGNDAATDCVCVAGYTLNFVSVRTIKEGSSSGPESAGRAPRALRASTRQPQAAPAATTAAPAST